MILNGGVVGEDRVRPHFSLSSVVGDLGDCTGQNYEMPKETCNEV